MRLKKISHDVVLSLNFNAGILSFVFRASFLACYLSACLVQVWLLLRASPALVRRLWCAGVDPDDAALPYLTAAGDLIGGALLAVVFKMTA